MVKMSQVMFSNSILGNYCVDSFFGNFIAESSPFTDSSMQSEVVNFSQTNSSKCIDFVSDNLELVVNNEFWTLFFDGSKSNEGVGAGCVLQDPNGNKTMLAYRLEFQCTNNVDEYEALIQGLKKAIDLNVKFIKVYGDSKIIVKQVRNTIHCVSNHLKNYQQLVLDLLPHFTCF
jgi:hypothetical protein